MLAAAIAKWENNKRLFVSITIKSCGFGTIRDWQLLNLRDIFENTNKYLLFLFQMQDLAKMFKNREKI